MSAFIEELFQKIVELEAAIQEGIAAKRNVEILQIKLQNLKEQFDSLNENLHKSEKILKG